MINNNIIEIPLIHLLFASAPAKPRMPVKSRWSWCIPRTTNWKASGYLSTEALQQENRYLWAFMRRLGLTGAQFSATNGNAHQSWLP
jgi:hypothetical protein